MLNLGNSKIISVHNKTARQIIKHPHFHGDVQVRTSPGQRQERRCRIPAFEHAKRVTKLGIMCWCR